jgi:hypothetical protein
MRLFPVPGRLVGKYHPIGFVFCNTTKLVDQQTVFIWSGIRFVHDVFSCPAPSHDSHVSANLFSELTESFQWRVDSTLENALKSIVLFQSMIYHLNGRIISSDSYPLVTWRLRSDLSGDEPDMVSSP